MVKNLISAIYLVLTSVNFSMINRVSNSLIEPTNLLIIYEDLEERIVYTNRTSLEKDEQEEVDKKFSRLCDGNFKFHSFRFISSNDCSVEGYTNSPLSLKFPYIKYRVIYNAISCLDSIYKLNLSYCCKFLFPKEYISSSDVKLVSTESGVMLFRNYSSHPSSSNKNQNIVENTSDLGSTVLANNLMNSSKIDSLQVLCQIKLSSTIDSSYPQRISNLSSSDRNQDTREVNLTMALRNYFVEDIRDLDSITLSTTLIKSSKIYSSKMLSERELTKKVNLYHQHRQSLPKEEYDRLQHGTILAVWEVISYEKELSDGHKKEIGSGLLGLLRDDRTGQLFYFDWDLGQDISVLLNYSSEERSEPKKRSLNIDIYSQSRKK